MVKCKIVLLHCVDSTNCSMVRLSFPFVGPHCQYDSPFLKIPTPLSAGCKSAALHIPFNELSVSCTVNVFNVSLFMFNTLSYVLPHLWSLSCSLCMVCSLFSFSLPPQKFHYQIIILGLVTSSNLPELPVQE